MVLLGLVVCGWILKLVLPQAPDEVNCLYWFPLPSSRKVKKDLVEASAFS